ASGWSGYFVSFLEDRGIFIDPKWITTPGTEMVFYKGHWAALTTLGMALQTGNVDPASLPHATGVFNVVAFLAIAFVTCVLVFGIKESANFNSAIVIVKVAIVLVFIGIAGMFVIRHPSLASANWHPFIPPNTGQFGFFGWSGIARGASVIFFAYIGFDAVSTAAQECKNPQKDMPIGIIGSLAICTVLYVVFGFILTGMVSYKDLGVAAPVALAIDKTPFVWMNNLIKFGIICGFTSVMLVMLLGQSRVFYSMSRDGLVPKVFSEIHPRFQTPWRSNMLFFFFVAPFSALLPLNIVGRMTSIGTLFAFVIVCAGVWVMRVKHPDQQRPFRTPWVPLVPILGMVVNFALM